MPTEAGRHRLYETIKEQWGEQNADELMSYLPPVGWADVATKGDLDALRVATKQDLETLRVATKQDLDALRIATKHELAILSAELRAKIDHLRSDIDKDSKIQLRWIVGAVLTAQAGTITAFALFVNWLA